MKRNDLYLIAILVAIVLVIFYPLFSANYLYTDEAVQLWLYRRGSGFGMFTSQGRYITEKIFQWLFSSINTIDEIIKLRLFSLFGWITCIPVWYYIIQKIVAKENLTPSIAFFSMVYLITIPSFIIYVSWASVIELFIANTSGLIAGYFLYTGIRFEKNTLPVTPLNLILSILFGCISLFTYQNGFGCFLLPFLLHFISTTKTGRKVVVGVCAYFLVYFVYFALFKLSLHLNHLSANERTSLHINIGNKLPYFLARPLSSAFHFTYLFNEKSITGFIVYLMTAGTWILISFYRLKKISLIAKLKYFVIIFCCLGLIFLPSLVVKENYASNRTLFSLNLAVFFLVATTVLHSIKANKVKYGVVILVSVFFIINAWYNFNRQYLNPLKKEYMHVRDYIESNYNPGIDTIYFIRPGEDFFVKKYGITRSWDEFGVPSTFFEWTPEFLVRQIVFEKTRNRNVAEKLVIKNWLGKETFLKSGHLLSNRILLVDTEELMKYSN